MNKTVNINLGGLIFHIDENAYQKLQNYLNAVKRSFSGASGEDEIISDIEARIAELFAEKMLNDRQVVGVKEVEDVIVIMGQPEDYMVDEDIFEDEPKARDSKRSLGKKFYRDPENKYIGGVSSGLAHYFGVDALWVRLLFVATAIFGIGEIIYILLWILIPKANTTAEKIAMTGEAINISNIEKKIKEGFDTASDSVKNVDYQKYGNKAQNGISSFFDAIAKLFMTLFKVFGKFIGGLLVLVGVATVLGLLIGFFTASSFDLFGLEFGNNQLEMYDYAPSAPIWLMSLLTFFAVGIPFFFIAYLGLKILITNLKSIGSIAKFSLLGIWLLAVISLSVIGIKTAVKTNENASTVIKEDLQITANDTLQINMVANELYTTEMRRDDDGVFVYDEEDNKQILSQDVRLIVKSTTDSIASIQVKKEADGATHAAARDRAKDISYVYALNGNVLELNNYLLISPEQKCNNQEVEITLYLPEGTVLFANENTYDFHRNNSRYNDILNNEDEEHYLLVLKNKTECLDCPINEDKDEDEDGNFTIDEDGIRININEDNQFGKVIIGEDGIDIDVRDGSETVILKIDKDGIRIQNEENKENQENQENQESKDND